MKRTNHPGQFDLLALMPEPEPPLFRKLATGSSATALIAAAQAQADHAFDFQRIAGQETAKRALEIAVTGGCSIMLRGSGECPIEDLRYASYKLRGDVDPDWHETRICETDGRLYERTDLFVDMSPTHPDDLRCPPPCEPTADIAARMPSARSKLAELCPGYPDDDAIEAVPMIDLALRLWGQAVEAMRLDEAAQLRVKRVAIVIAAMAGADQLGRVHVAEALSYQPRIEDRMPVNPPPAKPCEEPDGRLYWQTAAHEHGGKIIAYESRPAPIELTIRGVRTVVAFGMGFSTHAVDQPGTPYWSETGFRSFTCSPTTDPARITAIIEAFIDAPTKDGGGRGGKLSPWWTLAVRQLQSHRDWMARAERVTPEMHEQDRLLALEVEAEGFKPERVAPLRLKKATA